MPLLLLAAALPVAAAQWTVGVYMCADNGMNDQSYVDIAEMKQVGSTSEVNVIIQVDNAARDSHPGCRRYRVRLGELDNLGELGAVDMAAPATIADFARFLKDRYPAKNYIMVFWDHGNGWTFDEQGRSRAIFIDESHNSRMSVAGGGLSEALSGVRSALGTRLAVLGFDACYMGMVEVACEAGPYCDFLAASEGLVPWGGWDYEEFLGQLTARPTRPADEVVAALCAQYVTQYPGEDVCLSGVDLRQLERALGTLAATVRDSLDPSRAAAGNARSGAQTFPEVLGVPPSERNDQLDLIHFLELATGADSAAAALTKAVVANAHSGRLENARGIATWFPYRYLALKYQSALYDSLAYADTVGWLRFLDRYFGTDDAKPSTPAVESHRAGRRGDIRFYWSAARDLAPVTYNLYEVTGPREAFSDEGESLDHWMSYGWTASSGEAHSGSRSFFSGSAANLDNWLEAVAPLDLSGGGLLSLYAFYSTEEAQDTAGAFSRDICYIDWSPDREHWRPVDSLYGSAAFWHELRYVLPPSAATYLRFRYLSNAANNGMGCYVDDIKVYAFDTMRLAARGTEDTTAYVFNLARDTAGYSYFITGTDSFGNISMASQLYEVTVRTWAEPYTRPAPFTGPCKLVLDFPAGETPDVLIYTLAGTLVRRLEDVDEPVFDWDGCNESGKELADGLYIVVVQGETFRKLGKIARVSATR